MYVLRYCLFTAVIASMPLVVPAQPGEQLNCIDLRRIEDTEIIDSQNVIFTMTDGTNYLNTLPHICARLSRSGTILYRSTADRLCNVDTISTLEKFGGGFHAGPACGLGEFVSIGTEDIEVMRLRIQRQ